MQNINYYSNIHIAVEKKCIHVSGLKVEELMLWNIKWVSI